ncbi:MAG: NAD(P)/FAD-dependent oxidoreductase [Candidatus Dependentiae bacterium]|nr:NAD(P)/FAD-dependent oxidoreductase [Candidatus Dependentiae bacterium]
MYFYYIIIGNSAAGISALRAIRSHDKNNSIAVITQSGSTAYNTCLLSDFLQKKYSVQDLIVYDQALAEKDNVTIFAYTKVVQIDDEHKLVVCEDGRIYRYEKLLLATGCKPLLPTGINLNSQTGVFTYHTMYDIQEIQKYLSANPVKDVAVIGAGITGLECACALSALGLSVTLIEKKRILGVWPESAGRWICNYIQDHYKIVCLEQTCVKIILYDNNKVSGVLLDNNTQFSTQLIIFAVGIKVAHSAIAFSRLQSIETNIKVDCYMQTDSPSIYAAGDAVQVSSHHGLLPIAQRWTEAVYQGMCAGLAMVSKDYAYTSREWETIINLPDSMIAARGQLLDHAWLVEEVYDKLHYKYLVFDSHGCLQAYLIVGDRKALAESRKRFKRGSSL